MIKITCTKCKNPATEGSMKHPYCIDCFKSEWNGDYIKYAEWLIKTH